jgi:hypothetical protein
MAVTLSLAGAQHDQLRRHLFPGDGKEAAAIVLCGRRAGTGRHRLLGQQILPIPHEACLDRSSASIEWSTDLIEPWLRRADAADLSVVKVHSHPGYWPRFSKQDDQSDRDLFPCIDGAIDANVPHASVIMLPDGSMFGRVVTADGDFEPLDCIVIVGDDLRIWRPCDFGHEPAPVLAGFTKRHAQAFGAKTTSDLSALAVAVIGCSGTGSPVIAQLAHLGIGRLVLIDPDRVLEHNLNRILYATMADIGRFKVDVLGDAVERIGLGTIVERWPVNLYCRDAVHAVAGCDAVIGCSDTAEARFLTNLISNFYVMPYIDVGVTLETEGEGEISQVCGYVHYLQPGGSSVLSRGVITLDDVRAEGMRRQNPEFYEEQRKAGYIKGVDEDRPAVISVNMQFGALAVTELIARLSGFRENPNRAYAKIGMSLSEVAYYPEPEMTQVCRYMSRQVGKGDIQPLLNLPELGDSP